MLSHGPVSLSFSESVTVSGARSCINWASTFPLLSPVGKGVGLCFLRADRSHHGSSSQASVVQSEIPCDVSCGLYKLPVCWWHPGEEQGPCFHRGLSAPYQWTLSF